MIFFKGSSFTVYKNLLWSKKDDFKELIKDFEVLLNEYNKKQIEQAIDTTPKTIKFGDNTYLNNALLFFSFSVVLFLMMLSSFNNEEFNYMALGGFVLLFGLGLNFLHIHRKIKKNE